MFHVGQGDTKKKILLVDSSFCGIEICRITMQEGNMKASFLNVFLHCHSREHTILIPFTFIVCCAGLVVFSSFAFGTNCFHQNDGCLTRLYNLSISYFFYTVETILLLYF